MYINICLYCTSILKTFNEIKHPIYHLSKLYVYLVFNQYLTAIYFLFTSLNCICLIHVDVDKYYPYKCVYAVKRNIYRVFIH